MLCLRTGSVERSEALVDRTRRFATSVSFGSVGSRISMPCRMSHASIPAEVRRARALPEDLVRLSIGLEDPEDLVEDIAVGLSGR